CMRVNKFNKTLTINMIFSLQCYRTHHHLLSFPTRRSSDLEWVYFDIHCALNHAGRSLIRGSMYDDKGRLCLTMAQELLIRPTNRSEEHTSELQSPCNLVCRRLLEKKKTQ